MLYGVWPILDFATASRRDHDYFGDDIHASELVRSTEDSASAVEFLELDMDLGIPAVTHLSPGPPLLSSALFVLRQASTARLSLRSSTVAPALLAFSLEIHSSTRVARDFSATGLSSTVVPVSVDAVASPSSYTKASMVVQSSTSLISASLTLSRPCAVVISSGSLPIDTGDARASDVATLSRQLAVARRQRDAARQELASVRSELHRVRDEDDELRLALALFHAPFYESRLPL